jgi:hypothetical protein
MEDVENVDFRKLLGIGSGVWCKTVTLSAAKVVCGVPATDALSAERVVTVPDTAIHTIDGEAVSAVGRITEILLHSPGVREQLLREGAVEHTRFTVRFENPSGADGISLHLRRLTPDVLRPIEFIEVTGPCEFKITQFGMRRGKLGDVHVAWGKGEIAGQDAMIVATRNLKGDERLSVNVTGLQVTNLRAHSAILQSAEKATVKKPGS